MFYTVRNHENMLDILWLDIYYIYIWIKGGSNDKVLSSQQVFLYEKFVRTNGWWFEQTFYAFGCPKKNGCDCMFMGRAQH